MLRLAFQPVSSIRIGVRTLAISADFRAAHDIYVKKAKKAIIPVKFRMPGDWLEDLEGMEIGKESSIYRRQFRSQKLSQEDFEELEAMGFAWDVDLWNWEERVVPSLEVYEQTHGNLNVEHKFVVPFIGAALA